MSTTSTILPQPILVPRCVIRPVAKQLGLPLGSLGSAFAPADNPASDPSVLAWWNSLTPAQQTPRGVLAVLAAPSLVADIRAVYRQRSEVRTWALTGGVRPESTWMLVAPVMKEANYHVQPLRSREWVVNSLLGYLQAEAPVWETRMVFHCTVTEFALLAGLVDVYSRTEYASLIVHQPVPKSMELPDLVQSWQNVVQFPDRRYFLPSIAHMLPPPVRNLTAEKIPALLDLLVRRGMLARDGNTYAWSEAGRFFADSLHRRVCTLALAVAGANASGQLGSQGSVFVRSDRPLWYIGLDPSPDGQVTVVGVSQDNCRKLLDEALTPVGQPPLETELRPRPVPPSVPLPAATAAPKQFCGACGTPLEPGIRFCGNCGEPV